MTHSLTGLKQESQEEAKGLLLMLTISNDCTAEGKGSLSFSCLLLSSSFFVAPGTGNESLFLRLTLCLESLSHTNPSLDEVFHGNAAQTDEGSKRQTSLSLALSPPTAIHSLL